MNILVLGGTGAIGRHLVDILASRNVNCTVTTRKNRENKENVTYIKGNALNDSFLNLLLEKYWDVIVDFMVYTDLNVFSIRIKKILQRTNQYIFISSSRVYASSDGLLKETSSRLLDTSKDKAFLRSNEYALMKAKEENIILESGLKNWTIVRPYLTYSSNRLQLGSLEKEAWLYRLLKGRSLVFSEDISSKYTTLTYGYDVAAGIANLISKRSSLGEIFNITTSEFQTWGDVLKIYLRVLEEKGKKINIVMQKETPYSFFLQTKYDRLFNRYFDNSKFINIACDFNFTPLNTGLSRSIEEFLKDPVFNKIDWKKEATSDRITKERTPLSEIPSIKDKFIYLIIRYLFSFRFLSTLSHKIRNMRNFMYK